MVQPDGMFTVVFGGKTIGWVEVDESYPTHFFGWFRAAAGHDAGQTVIDEAIALSRLYDLTLDPAERSAIFEKECALARVIAACVQLPELPEEIEEFAIHHSGEVEITLKRPPD
jgi:hypothetical protein